MVGAVITMRRRLTALAAAYAIALQAVLASFAALAAAGTAEPPGLCTSAGAQEQPGRPTGHTSRCIACLACCGDGRLSALPPAAVELPAPRAAADRDALQPPAHDARATPRDRPPPRAPPAT
jgi:hypothetical protein